MKVKFTIKLCGELDVEDRILHPDHNHIASELAIDHVSDIIKPKLLDLPHFMRKNLFQITYE